MSAFVAKPGAPDRAPDTIIAGDGFLPDVDTAAIRADMRVAEAVTPARLRSACIGAMLSVRRDLAAWIAERKAAGEATLAAVAADTIDGESVNLALYARAIGCRAKAELVDRSPDLDATGAGDRRAAVLEPTADALRRDATFAIRDLLGRDRTTVELI